MESFRTCFLFEMLFLNFVCDVSRVLRVERVAREAEERLLREEEARTMAEEQRKRDEVQRLQDEKEAEERAQAEQEENLRLQKQVWGSSCSKRTHRHTHTHTHTASLHQSQAVCPSHHKQTLSTIFSKQPVCGVFQWHLFTVSAQLFTSRWPHVITGSFKNTVQFVF